MTRRPPTSYLIRLERSEQGQSEGTVTSVATGDRASFIGLPEMLVILERWSESSGASTDQEAQP